MAYINYLNLRVDLDKLLANLLKNVLDFANSLPYRKSTKERFLGIYNDVIKRGLKDIPNDGSSPGINVGGDAINMSTLSNTDRALYGDVARFINLEMSNIAEDYPKEEEKKEEPLLKFDNEYFIKDFGNYLSGQEFGGNTISMEKDWNSLDTERDERGLKSRKNRAAMLANNLESYSKSLLTKKYDFKDTPFKDVWDLRSRLLNAVSALRDNDISNDAEALRRIGLNESDWFNNGSGDPFKKDGYTGTYGDYYQNYLPSLQKLEEKKELDKLKSIDKELEKTKNTLLNSVVWKSRINNPKGFLTVQELGSKYNGDTEQLKAVLKQYKIDGLKNLDPEQLREVISAYHIGAKDDINKDEEFILKHTKTYGFDNFNKNRFKKFQDIDGIVYDTATGTIIQISDKNIEKLLSLDFLKGYSLEELDLLHKAAANNRLMFLAMLDPNNVRYKNEDGSINFLNLAADMGVDGLRVGSMIDDIIAGVASFIPVYGTAVSAAASVKGLLLELVADSVDWARGEADGKTLLTNLGTNAGFTALGLIPGGKLPKIAKSISRFALPLTGLILSSTTAYNLYNNPEVKKSWNKILNLLFNDFTVGDSKNVLALLGAVAGTLLSGRGLRNAYKFRKEGVVNTETKIKGKEGEYKTTTADVKEMNEIGAKKGHQEAEKFFNERIVKNLNNGGPDKLPFTYEKQNWFLRNLVPPFLRNTKTAEVTTTLIPSTLKTRAQMISEAVKQGKTKLENGEELPWAAKLASKYAPKGMGIATDYDFLYAMPWNKKPQNTTTSRTPVRLNPPVLKKPLTEAQYNYNRETINRYKQIMNNLFSANTIVPGKYKFGPSNLEVKKLDNNSYDLVKDGIKVGNYSSQLDLLKRVRDLIKETAKMKDSGGKHIITAKEMGEILREYAKNGILKRGGNIVWR